MSLLILFQNNGATASNTNNIPLFISGSASASVDNNIALFIQGYDKANNNVSLYISGSVQNTGSISLYEVGTQASTKNMNLFLKGNEPLITNNNIDLNISGCNIGSNGQYSSINLFVNGVADYASLNLFVSGNSYGRTAGNMNLFTVGGGVHMDAHTDLFINNNISGKFNSIPLIIKGDGVGNGGYPINNHMNLYLQRNPTGCIPLFISVATPVTNNVNLFIDGATNIAQSINLTIPHTIGLPNNMIQLYTHGF